MTITLAALLAGAITLLYAQQNGGDAKKELKKQEEKNNYDVSKTGWRIRDFKPYVKAIKDLEKLNKEYSESLLKLAVDEYATGLDILEDMESEILKLERDNKSRKHLNERYYWQEIDRKNREKRVIERKKYKSKMKAITYFIRSIKTLDNILNKEVRQDPRFLKFQTRLYQAYVSTQYDLHNFRACIPILERYVNLTEESKKDVWAYKYMASCYGYVEKTLMKARNISDSEVMKYRSLKNRSMLQAVELTYGTDSPHYKTLQEIVELDEKKSERINDFK